MGNPLMQLFGGSGNGGSGNNMLMQLMQIMQGGGNPQSALQMLSKQYPQLQTFLPMLKGGNFSMEQLCRTLCKQKGVNFDELYKQAQTIINKK